MESFGVRIRKLRKQAGFTSTHHFAEAINKSTGFVSRLESPENDGTNIKMIDLLNICKVLNVTLNDLYEQSPSSDVEEKSVQLRLSSKSYNILCNSISQVRSAIEVTGIESKQTKLDDYTNQGLTSLILAELYSSVTNTPRDEVRKSINVIKKKLKKE